MNIKRVEIIKCPRCEATCKVGNDDDFQVYCACCMNSFMCKDAEKEISEQEYNEMKKNASEVYAIGAWEAFK